MEDLSLLILNGLGIPHGVPLHVDVAVTLVIHQEHSQGDIVALPGV